MGRLIDADSLIKELQEQMKTATNPLFAMVCDKCIDDLEKQPTAYDVDKVVAEVQNVHLPLASQTARIVNIIRKGGVE